MASSDVSVSVVLHNTLQLRLLDVARAARAYVRAVDAPRAAREHERRVGGALVDLRGALRELRSDLNQPKEDKMTRCKFTCMSVTKRKAWSGAPTEFVYDAEFQAVARHDAAPTREAADENAGFWAATPAGTLKLSTVRADHFEVGKDYYLDLTLV